MSKEIDPRSGSIVPYLTIPKFIVNYLDEVKVEGEFKENPKILQNDYLRLCNINPDNPDQEEHYANGDSVMGSILETIRTKNVNESTDIARDSYFKSETYKSGGSRKLINSVGRIANMAFMKNALFISSAVELNRHVTESPEPKKLKESDKSSILIHAKAKSECYLRYKNSNEFLFQALKFHGRAEAGALAGVLHGPEYPKTSRQLLQDQIEFRSVLDKNFALSAYVLFRSAELKYNPSFLPDFLPSE